VLSCLEQANLKKDAVGKPTAHLSSRLIATMMEAARGEAADATEGADDKEKGEGEKDTEEEKPATEEEPLKKDEEDK